MIQIKHLERLFEIPVAAWLSRALGYDRSALTQRVRRGSPEITAVESRRIEQALAAVGLSVDTSTDDPTAA